MYKLIVENENGEKLNLFPSDDYFTSITGLNPPIASVNTTAFATGDGAKFNSSKIQPRNVVVTVRFLRDVEKNRIALYRFFKVKKSVKMHFENSSRSIHFNGYVESFEFDLFNQFQAAQISIICPDPSLYDELQELIQFNQAQNAFQFPFQLSTEISTLTYLKSVVVDNLGDVECGMMIRLKALGENILNPKIYNEKTGEFFSLNYDMSLGEVIEINTNRGKLSVVSTLGNGKTTNLMNHLTKNSTWLQLASGTNYIAFTADAGEDDLQVELSYCNQYEGV